MEQLTYERLQDNLKRLKLNRAAEILDTVVTHSEKNDGSYLAFLDHLLEEEVAAREKRRMVFLLPKPSKNMISPFTPNWRKKPCWSFLI